MSFFASSSFLSRSSCSCMVSSCDGENDLRRTVNDKGSVHKDIQAVCELYRFCGCCCRRRRRCRCRRVPVHAMSTIKQENLRRLRATSSLQYRYSGWDCITALYSKSTLYNKRRRTTMPKVKHEKTLFRSYLHNMSLHSFLEASLFDLNHSTNLCLEVIINPKRKDRQKKIQDCRDVRNTFDRRSV